MAGLRYEEIRNNQYELLDLTSLTKEEFEILVPIFEQKYQEHTRQWRMDGKKRNGRKYTTYANCPLPTPEDRLLFILIFVKNNPLQALQGRLFAMVQCKANQWIHLLLPVLLLALKQMGDTPSRSMAELAIRLGVCEVEATALVCSNEVGLNTGQTQSTEVAKITPTTNIGQAFPLFVTMQQSDPLEDPKIRLNKKAIIAARKNATR